MASTILNASSVNAGGSGGSSSSGNVYIWTSTSTNYPTSSVTVPSSYTINSGGTYSTSAWTSISNNGSQPSLQVTGNAEVAGTLKVGGKDIAKSLEAIEKRLAILVPDPDKLEHFEALKKAYEHYKLLEALCEVPKEKKE